MKYKQLFDEFKLWDIKKVYSDKEIVGKANDICQGIMHCHKIIPGLQYDISSFDWGINYSDNSRSFQLYLQSLNPIRILTRAYELTHDSYYLAYGKMVIKSWKKYSDLVENRKNNYFVFCDHSVAGRSNNLIYYGKICLDSDYIDDELMTILYEILEEGGVWLADFKNYKQKHNHGIMQDEALLHLGVLLKRDNWVKIARIRLYEQYKHAFAKDGVHVENSPAYHQMVYSMFNRISDWLKSVGDLFENNNVMAIDYLDWVCMPNGYLAQIGDSAGYKKAGYRAEISEKRSVKDYHVMFAYSGIYFYRSCIDKNPSEDTWKTIKAGYSCKTHKHADDGSFILYSKGYEIFSDCGFCGYKRDDFQRYIMSAKAHNCVIVDGNTWSPTEKNAGKTGIKDYKFHSYYDEIKTFNDAYEGVHIERNFLSMDDLTILSDKTSSDKEHTYTQLFHLGESMEILQVDSREVTIKIADSGYVLRLRQHGTPPELKVYKGDAKKADYGIIYRGVNNINETSTLAFSIKGKTGEFVTTLAIEDLKGRVRIFDRFMQADSLKYDFETGQFDWDEKILKTENRILKIGNSLSEIDRASNDNLPPESVYWYDECIKVLAENEWTKGSAVSLYNHHAMPWRETVEIQNILRERKPTAILELGLRESSKLIAQYASYTGAKHVIIDESAEESMAFLQTNPAIFTKTKVNISPLTIVEKDGHQYCCFKNSRNIIGNIKFDMIIQHRPRGENSSLAYADLGMYSYNLLGDKSTVLFEGVDDYEERFLIDDIANTLKKHDVDTEKKYIPLPKGECCLLEVNGVALSLGRPAPL